MDIDKYTIMSRKKRHLSMKFIIQTRRILGMIETLAHFDQDFQLKWVGKKHLRCLTKDGGIVCWGTQNIYNYLTYYMQNKFGGYV